jgi:hypothetical protein
MRHRGAKLAEALVAKDDLMRLFVNVGIMLRRDPTIRRRVFTSVEAARAWLQTMLDEASAARR